MAARMALGTDQVERLPSLRILNVVYRLNDRRVRSS